MAQLAVRSSGSSTSSMSSTFSDLASSTSTASSSSPPRSKTSAFFASPFGTRPPSPSPVLQARHVQPDKPRSLTADFFATPVRPPSPPPSARAASTSIPASSIFPSRYTSSSSQRSRDFTTLPDDLTPQGFYPSPIYRSRTSSIGSDELPTFASPTSSTFSAPRLPTPPPPSHPRSVHREDTIMPGKDTDMRDEPTPRPEPREPALLKFERSLLLARQTERSEPEEMIEDEEEEMDQDELKEGSIIMLPSSFGVLGSSFSPPAKAAPLPISPLTQAFTIGPEDPATDRGTRTPTPMGPNHATPMNRASSRPPSPIRISSSRSSRLLADFATAPNSGMGLSPPDSITESSMRASLRSDDTPPSSPTSTSKLRLLRPLGHGAFSAVWLAEDLSRVPLTLVSKRSVRDLRRRASGRDKEDKTSDKAEMDYEWKMLSDRNKERTRTPELVQTKPGLGEHDVTPRAAATLPPTLIAKESPKRQASRIREGLRNMLSFSRGTHTSPSLDTEKTGSMPTDNEISPSSPMSSGSSQHSAAYSSLSRTSSLKSSTSGPDYLSRSSSIASQVHVDANKTAALLRDASLRKFRARVHGTRPALSVSGRTCLDERDGEMGLEKWHDKWARGDWDGERDLLQSSLTRKPSSNAGGSSARTPARLVAVKMTMRRLPRGGNAGVKGNGARKDVAQRERHRVKARREEEERTRVRFVREVEVLKHISHPNITPLLAHLSTATHHILVLPYLPGGDLLGLVNNEIAWAKLTESVLRRIWLELCKAVGWMHGVGLVHRDIKLENILLTTSIFSTLDLSSPPPSISSLPTPPAPFIQLTDFGLSRFVELKPDGEAEPLSTRCGSEAYAAPELVTGGGVYDARKTDAWACGVVLYALIGRVLPFGESAVAHAAHGTGSRIGGERAEDSRVATPAERRHWLMRIARGEWQWPEGADEDHESAHPTPQSHGELAGAELVRSRGARRIVNRLLVRDMRKRARIADLWDDAWMSGAEDGAAWTGGVPETREDAPAAPPVMRIHSADEVLLSAECRQTQTPPWDGDAAEFWTDAEDVNFYNEPTWIEGFSEDPEDDAPIDDEDVEPEADGCLLDQDGIHSITRQEVI